MNYIKNNIKKKIPHESKNDVCFKLEEKSTGNVRKNKNSFIEIMGDKFAMSVLDEGN